MQSLHPSSPKGEQPNSASKGKDLVIMAVALNDEILHFTPLCCVTFRMTGIVLINAALPVQSLNIDYYNAAYRGIPPERRYAEPKQATNMIRRSFSTAALSS